MKLYMRLLDAARDGADWREAVRIPSISIQSVIPSVAAAFMTRISHERVG